MWTKGKNGETRRIKINEKKREREPAHAKRVLYDDDRQGFCFSFFSPFFSSVCVYCVHGRGEYIELYSTDTNTDRHTHTNSA